MNKKIKTIDDLAELMVRTMASKEDIKAVQQDINALEERLTTGLDRIENPLLAEQKREIEDLKKCMKQLEDALAV